MFGNPAQTLDSFGLEKNNNYGWEFFLLIYQKKKKKKTDHHGECSCVSICLSGFYRQS